MLIGLNGVSRSGKDSVAGVLVKRYGFKQIALATKIREILLDIDPWLEDADAWMSTLHKEFAGNWDMIKATSRDSVEYMISLGQSLRDRIDEDVWIVAAMPGGYNFERDGHIVISDIRQPNEVGFLYQWGGEIWHIERPELGGEKRGMDDLLSDIRFDANIVNDGTLEDLEETVSWIIEQDIK